MDVIGFGPDKPRRPLLRPPRRVVATGVVAVACAALLVAGIVAVRRGGHAAPSAAAPSSTASPPGAAAPSTAAPPSTTVPARPPSTADAPPPSNPAVPDDPTARQCSSPLRMAGLAIDGVQPKAGRTLARCDRDAGQGPWTVVVRRHDGSLGDHGAVVTFPVGKPAGGQPVKVNGIPGTAVTGTITWPLAKAYARIRGDLDNSTLLAIAERTTVDGRRPRVRPPGGYAVVWSGPYRAPEIHEIRYGSQEIGEADALGGGLTYTGLTNGGGGFEDQLYVSSTAGGPVGGVPTVLSGVGGGNATLAWELEPGVVAYVGYSGAALDDEAAAALRRLAGRARLMSLEDWWFSKPQTTYQVNEPG